VGISLAMGVGKTLAIMPFQMVILLGDLHPNGCVQLIRDLYPLYRLNYATGSIDTSLFQLANLVILYYNRLL
jgi:hypothetical protein